MSLFRFKIVDGAGHKSEILIDGDSQSDAVAK
jgi:hypothetical protein